MTEIQVWILSGLVGLFVMVGLVLLKGWVSQQAQLLEAINSLKQSIAVQNEQLRTLFNERINNRSEIKELDRRVGKLETDKFRCKNYEEL